MSENEEKEKGSRLVLSKKMSESTKHWKIKVDDLTRRIREDKLMDVVDIQAEAISHRQDIVEEVRKYSVIIYKSVQKMKGLQKSRFEFYATSYQVKTNGTEKLKLIEADLSEYQCFIDELDEHVTFLRETSKNFDNINYAVKNKIELANILGTT